MKPLLIALFTTLAIVIFGVPLVFFPALVGLSAKYVVHLPINSIWPPLGVSLSGTLAAVVVLRLFNTIGVGALKWMAYSVGLVAGLIAFKFLYHCPWMDALQTMVVAGLPMAVVYHYGGTFVHLFARSRQSS